MNSVQRCMIVVNVIGGLSVLGSYALAFIFQQDAALLWGGVPDYLRSTYSVCMLLAAAGYLLFTFYLLFRVRARELRVFNHFGYEVFVGLYLAILLPSALWMPLTLMALNWRSPLLLWAVRLDLLVTALASLLLLLTLVKHQPIRSIALQRWALAGAVFFCVQTVILDAGIWLAYFHL